MAVTLALDRTPLALEMNGEEAETGRKEGQQQTGHSGSRGETSGAWSSVNWTLPGVVGRLKAGGLTGLSEPHSLASTV